ncbi:hypothetical protein FGB62_218g08 [Gracilaria domingensis]|nr:hypothetical protein FGB62_218g08 [Gracilaria domingensis]
MMHSFRITHIQLDEGVPRDVVTIMPDDVIQGVLLALRSSGGLACESLRVVRLTPMTCTQLQAALNRLHGCSALTELCFVDEGKGVRMSKGLARRLKTLSITSPRVSTLKALREARCAPKILQLCGVGDEAVFELHKVWRELTRKSTSVGVTWSGSLVPRYECYGGRYLPFSDAQLQMAIESTRRLVPLGPMYASSVRALNDERTIETALGWKTVLVSDWLKQQYIQDQMPVVEKTSLLELDMLEEEGLLTVVVEPFCDNGRMYDQDIKDFMFEAVIKSPREERKWHRHVGKFIDGAGHLTAVVSYRGMQRDTGNSGTACGADDYRRQRARSDSEHVGVHGTCGSCAACNGEQRGCSGRFRDQAILANASSDFGAAGKRCGEVRGSTLGMDAEYGAARRRVCGGNGDAVEAGADDVSTRRDVGAVRRGRARRRRALDAREGMRARRRLRGLVRWPSM